MAGELDRAIEVYQESIRVCPTAEAHTFLGWTYSFQEVVYYEQRAKTMQLWAEPFVELRMPKIFNLRRDPFERADENSNGYWNWVLKHVFIYYGALVPLKQNLESFAAFPPRQKPSSFNLERVIEMTMKAIHGSHK